MTNEKWRSENGKCEKRQFLCQQGGIMFMRMKPALIACLLVALVTQPAEAMIRHVFIFEPAVSLDVFDIWYFRHHAPECVRFFGPWLRRYETYRASQVPAEADRFNPYRGVIPNSGTTASRRGAKRRLTLDLTRKRRGAAQTAAWPARRARWR